MIDILFFTLVGILLGIITGLIPGLHVNTVSFMLIGFAFLSPYHVIVLIISMAITHTIFDYIPSIFFGAPEAETALSILPGHRMLLEGKGLHALYLTVVGGAMSIVITLLLFPLILFLIPTIYQNIQPLIYLILLAIAAVMIYIEPGVKKIYGLFVFVMSGLLGIIVLNNFVLSSHMAFFPLFTGLFGTSTLLISLNKGVKIPKQVTWLPKIKIRFALIGTLKGLFSGMILGVLPGVGAAQATVLTQQITKKRNPREFLISIGAINTIVALFSLVSLYTISRPRSGAAVAVQSVIQNFGFSELLLLLGVTLVSTGVSVLLIQDSKASNNRTTEVRLYKTNNRSTCFLVGSNLNIHGGIWTSDTHSGHINRSACSSFWSEKKPVHGKSHVTFDHLLHFLNILDS